MTTRPFIRWTCNLCLVLSAAACFRAPDASAPNPDQSFAGRSKPSHAAAGSSSEPGSTLVSAGSTADAVPAHASAGSTADAFPATDSAGSTGYEPTGPNTSLDLLFVIDNSNSMEAEQSALRMQLPRMVLALTTGRLANGETFPPIHDLHVGVVSTDMGTAGVATQWPGCAADGGDDGILQHAGFASPTCAASYPPYLEYVQGRDNPDQLARDFACIADISIHGCAVKQPLEAALKALWPNTYTDSAGMTYPPGQNVIQFLSPSVEGRHGHGDSAPNAGFARNDGPNGPSTLAIVVVTDDEDCSSRSTSHFTPSIEDSDPGRKQSPNLRCFHNPQNLFALERYTIGFKALRPNHEDTVVFAAIVGVPVELVNDEARSTFAWSDESARNAYYDAILQDARMQERPLNEDIPNIGNLAPSCTRIDRDGTRADAYPPRRIVEVAKGFGENAILQSICQDDFTPVIDALLARMRARQ